MTVFRTSTPMVVYPYMIVNANLTRLLYGDYTSTRRHENLNIVFISFVVKNNYNQICVHVHLRVFDLYFNKYLFIVSHNLYTILYSKYIIYISIIETYKASILFLQRHYCFVCLAHYPLSRVCVLYYIYDRS